MFELADRLVGIYKTFDTTKSVTVNPRMFVTAPPGDEAGTAAAGVGAGGGGGGGKAEAGRQGKLSRSSGILTDATNTATSVP
jgi:hypothetical protein